MDRPVSLDLPGMGWLGVEESTLPQPVLPPSQLREEIPTETVRMRHGHCPPHFVGTLLFRVSPCATRSATASQKKSEKKKRREHPFYAPLLRSRQLENIRLPLLPGLMG